MGFVAPQVTGLIINGHNDVGHWRVVFLIATAVYLLGNVVFVIFGRATEQDWNRTAAAAAPAAATTTTRRGGGNQQELQV